MGITVVVRSRTKTEGGDVKLGKCEVGLALCIFVGNIIELTRQRKAIIHAGVRRYSCGKYLKIATLGASEQMQDTTDINCGELTGSVIVEARHVSYVLARSSFTVQFFF